MTWVPRAPFTGPIGAPGPGDEPLGPEPGGSGGAPGAGGRGVKGGSVGVPGVDPGAYVGDAAPGDAEIGRFQFPGGTPSVAGDPFTLQGGGTTIGHPGVTPGGRGVRRGVGPVYTPPSPYSYLTGGETVSPVGGGLGINVHAGGVGPNQVGGRAGRLGGGGGLGPVFAPPSPGLFATPALQAGRSGALGDRGLGPVTAAVEPNAGALGITGLDSGLLAGPITAFDIRPFGEGAAPVPWVLMERDGEWFYWNPHRKTWVNVPQTVPGPRWKPMKLAGAWWFWNPIEGVWVRVPDWILELPAYLWEEAIRAAYAGERSTSPEYEQWRQRIEAELARVEAEIAKHEQFLRTHDAENRALAARADRAKARGASLSWDDLQKANALQQMLDLLSELRNERVRLRSRLRAYPRRGQLPESPRRPRAGGSGRDE